MTLKIFLIVLIVLLASLANKHIAKWIDKLGSDKGVTIDRMFYLQKTFQIFFSGIAIAAGLITLGIGYSELDIFLSSIFAVIGITLFAQWSILSNITASVIIFFFFPYKVGQRISLIDKDKDKTLEGRLVEISLFYLLIENDNGERSTYPASLVFQNPIGYKNHEKDNDCK